MSSPIHYPPKHVKQTWQSQLVIDFVRSGVSRTFCHDDLRLMQNFGQEYIKDIAVYKCPLRDSQSSPELLLSDVYNRVSRTFCHDDLRLMQNFRQEYIIDIAVYKCPLRDSQSSPELLLSDVYNHQFVILRTVHSWYSIEKNDHYIYVQGSEYIDDVRCYKGNIPRRTPILGISYDFCQPGKTMGCMGDLIQFLHDKKELNDYYHPIFSNCQAFAKRIFDEFARPKKHEIISGCSPAFQVTPPWQNVEPTVEGLLPSPFRVGLKGPSQPPTFSMTSQLI